MTVTTPRPLRRLLSLTPLALVTIGLAACGSSDDDKDTTSNATTGATTTASAGTIVENPANDKITLTIGSKNFTEQKILGEIYAEALDAAGYEIKTELNLGDEQTALKTLESGQIDAYPEYTGTALLSFFGVKTDDLPHDPAKAFELAKTDFAKKDLVALPPTPFTNSNEVAVTKATADKYGLKNISDLKKVAPQLTLYGSPECRQRLDCLLGLEQTYGLKFKKFVPVDVSQRSKVLSSGQADVSIVFTTDPQNKRDNFVLLKDDKQIFPPYNSTLVVRKESYDKAGPDLPKTVELVNTQLTAANIQELGARVDLDKETPEQAAEEFLKQFGFVK